MQEILIPAGQSFALAIRLDEVDRNDGVFVSPIVVGWADTQFEAANLADSFAMRDPGKTYAVMTIDTTRVGKVKTERTFLRLPDRMLTPVQPPQPLEGPEDFPDVTEAS